jgi:hypothetical protein
LNMCIFSLTPKPVSLLRRRRLQHSGSNYRGNHI